MPRRVESARALIASVSNYPLLYTNDRAAYKRCQEKDLLWINVARDVFARTDMKTVSRTKIQWKSIRDAYVKYQKKRLEYPKIRPYIYEKDLEFLYPQVLETINKLKTVENHFISPNTSEFREEDTISISSCSESCQEMEQDQELLYEKEEPFEEVSFEYITKPNPAYEVRPDLIGRVKKSEPVEAQNEMFYNIEQDRKEHPVDAFFYGIAQTVKQLKPSTISRIKKAVTNIVLDAEAEELDQVEVSVLVRNR